MWFLQMIFIPMRYTGCNIKHTKKKLNRKKRKENVESTNSCVKCSMNIMETNKFYEEIYAYLLFVNNYQIQVLINWANVTIYIFFSLGLRKGYLKFEYKSDQEGEKTHILVKTAGL